MYRNRLDSIRLSFMLIMVSFINTPLMADPLIDALQQGQVKADFRLRYETVDEDNNLDDADALTLRSRLSYNSAEYQNFSILLELEDVRVVAGVDDYSVPATGFHPGEFSVIADPESTEFDQAYIQFKQRGVQAKLGRQVITYDNHRFVGHVGWRQDRQTFDGFSVSFKANKDLQFNYSFVGQRNFIFADDKDTDSKDHLVNVSLKTVIGKLVGYAYILEIDDIGNNSLDTYGLSLNGHYGNKDTTHFVYGLEFAAQEFDTAHSDFNANYLMAEAAVVSHGVTLKVSYESLGSDDTRYGFSTPLATLHKFNGWADIFLATPSQGLVDITLTAKGKVGPAKWMIAYHDFDAEDDMPGIDDFGHELNLQFVYPFNKHISLGLKYAAYYDGGSGTGKTDTDKLWLWTQLKF